MKLQDIKSKIPEKLFNILSKDLDELRPSQEKSINAGLFEGKNLLVCTPTASGKTLVAELAMLNNILTKRKKAVYIVPLRALASEKYKNFSKKYNEIDVTCGVSTGDLDAIDSHLGKCDIIIATAEKMDSLIRHDVSWIYDVGTIVIDEAHLVNDNNRGPTMEILITMLRTLLKDYQLIALSATIGNPQEFASWLDAELIYDEWRPVKLRKGILVNNEITYYE
jgi:helicase